uniref:Chalcone isomerase domain-containing protein n=1 Tax=Leptocylindrus danicus TaxID=163516 RepID=A0A7S2NT72_9STRA|eukprot:CAMPEP_0116024854 /NCGR_PEP_ID=MMETSP0321-20121206/12628_1 /TAXON_ID=163516 /ORGANISM="Leptocylindrus danicus var. danicus, Strain B650" /LENGTH=253 /DNA_ID=CAMNT_0003496791 /DNA_START=139 /DNA_END=900 /DNA_ORIENTATION=+
MMRQALNNILIRRQQTARRLLSVGGVSLGQKSANSASRNVALLTGLAVAATATASYKHHQHDSILCQAIQSVNNLMPTKEPKTGILFPHFCTGLTYVGCGVRVKYGFVKVYAVGTYVDPIAVAAVKKQSDAEIEKALLDPMYPRTIRIVMNRSLSIDKYMAAIVEAIEPRMGGVDLDKLKEFKDMNPPGDLIEGSEMTMTIRGDTMLYRNCAGSVGAIHSEVFCKALCDTYYGKDPVSPSHKEDVIKGIKKLP